MRLFVAAVLLLSAPASAAAPVSGQWLTVEKDSVVEIAPCGKALCGRIERILAAQPKGPSRDVNNPDPKLRNRTIQGMTILSGFTDTGKAWQGSIYDPRRGKTYKSYLALLPSGKLQVKGCLGPFCQSQLWTRAR
ncbi:MAG: DUF2147 domain-containing protein [Deltaproteobacteria bacterium]|nr:DUF2147 domain-containing protein [Deltaproteobacteria bacterium]